MMNDDLRIIALCQRIYELEKLNAEMLEKIKYYAGVMLDNI